MASSDLPLLRTSRFVTFDGAVTVETRHQRPDRYRHLEIDLGDSPRIARGGGFSYAAASFGVDVVVQEMRAFDRLLDHDGARTVRAEAGMTLLQLGTWALARGLHLPVMPGYPLITLGGCAAADVHGKNPARDGTFCDWVEALTLYSPSRGFHTASRTERPELFAATCGGFGLTGVIVDLTLRLAPLPAPNVRVEAHPVASLAEAQARLADSADQDFAYSWHDGTARGRHFGRGIVFVGHWTDEPTAAAPRARTFVPMDAARRGRWPVLLWTSWSAAAGNAWFAHSARCRPARCVSAFDAAFPFARQTLYHRGFGRAGLAEMQLLLPEATFGAFCERLHDLVETTPALVMMLSVKAFTGRQRSLSQSGSGLLLALDLARTPACPSFLDALDRLVLATGAQPNVAKDSRLPQALARAAIPAYDSFSQVVRQLDPARLWQSELSRRLGL